MKIESITIKNFKNFQNAEVTNLPDLAVFIGKNGSGKTSFFAYTIEQPYFQTSGVTLLIVCEEGEVEYDESRFFGKNVFFEVIENEEDLTEDEEEAGQEETE